MELHPELRVIWGGNLEPLLHTPYKPKHWQGQASAYRLGDNR